MHLDLSNEKALVTGASRGIGQAIALELGQAGAEVIGTATTTQGAEKITQYLSENQIKGQGMVLDVSVTESVEVLIKALGKAMPSILVNNAGIARDNLLIRMKDEEWDTVINTNLTGIYRLTKACLRTMLKAKQGRIINITSIVGLTGQSGQTNYAASKAGIIGFSKSLAREIGSRGITVNTIAPGFIETDMTQSLTEEQRTAIQQQIALNRLGTSHDVAQAVVFLASSASSYITGETLHVNGGMYMP
jgi:3-oxoacyl-[acyl-carrier protein] reductase